MSVSSFWITSVVIAVVADAFFIWAWRERNRRAAKHAARPTEMRRVGWLAHAADAVKTIPPIIVVPIVFIVAYASQFSFDLGEKGRAAGILLFAAVLPATWLLAFLERQSAKLREAEQAEASLSPRPAISWQALAEQPRRTFLCTFAVIATLNATTLARDEANNLAAGVLWAVGMILFLVACLPEIRLPGRAQLQTVFQRPTLVNGLAIIILAAGAFARLYALDRIPLGTEQDEGQINSEAYEIKDGNTLRLFGTAWFFDHTAVYSYLELASINLFGENIGGARMLPGVMGSLSLLFMYLLVRRMLGPGPALVTAALVAFAPFHLQFSRIAIHDMVVMELYIPATLYFLYRGLHTGRHFDFAAAGVFTGIGLWMDYNNKIMVLIPIVGVTFVYWIITHPRYWRTEYSKIGIYLAGVVIVLLPLWGTLGYYGGLWQDPARGKFLFASSHLDAAIQAYGTSNPVLLVLHQIEHVFFGINHFNDISFLVVGRSILDSVSAVFFFIGFAYSIARWKEPRYGMLLILLGVGMQMSIWSDNPPQAHRMTPVMLSAYFLASVGIITMGRVVGALFKWPKPYLGILAFLLLGGIGLNNLTTYLSPERDHLNWLEPSKTGELIREYAPDHNVYHVGAPWYYANGHGAILFNSRLMSKTMSSIEDVRSVLPLPVATRDVIFIISSGHLDNIQYLRDLYPDGALQELQYRGQTYLATYTISKGEINGRTNSQP